MRTSRVGPLSQYMDAQVAIMLEHILELRDDQVFLVSSFLSTHPSKVKAMASEVELYVKVDSSDIMRLICLGSDVANACNEPMERDLNVLTMREMVAGLEKMRDIPYTETFTMTYSGFPFKMILSTLPIQDHMDSIVGMVNKRYMVRTSTGNVLHYCGVQYPSNTSYKTSKLMFCVTVDEFIKECIDAREAIKDGYKVKVSVANKALAKAVSYIPNAVRKLRKLRDQNIQHELDIKGLRLFRYIVSSRSEKYVDFNIRKDAIIWINSITPILAHIAKNP